MKIFFFLLLAVGLANASVLPESPTAFKSQLSNAEFVFQKSTGEHSADQNEILAYQQLSKSNNVIEQNIIDLLESFREVVINGNDFLPPLDPLEIDQIGPFEYSTTGIRGSLTLRDVYFEGLRWYTIDDVVVNPLRLTIGLKTTVPRMRFLVTYDTRIRAALLLTYEAIGNIGIFINRFEFGFDMRVGTNLLAGHLVLREFNVRIGMGDLIVTVDGMTGSSVVNNVISGVVNTISQGVILENLDSINQAVSEALFDTINDILSDYTVSDIFGPTK